MPMNLRFGRARQRAPSELITKTKTALSHIVVGQTDRSHEKAVEDVGRFLEQIKVCLLGHDDQPVDKAIAMELNTLAIREDLVEVVLQKLRDLEFETMKDAGLVIAAFLRIKSENGGCPMAVYVEQSPEVLRSLVDGYRDRQDPHIGLISGGILRDCIKHQNLAKMIAESALLLQFVDDILESKFEIGADALCTFREVITKHKEMMAEILYRRFEEIFPQIHRLIKSDNFFVKRQSLKLLNEILLEEQNCQVVAKYVKDVQNLVLLMNLLRDKYETIQFEAFHSFKVFLIGSEKAPEVSEILRNNKEKLLKFFENFLNEKAEIDEEFREEKEYAYQLIQQIPDP